MIALGVILLLTAIGLIWFRTPLTGTRVGDGDIPFSIYIVNQSGQTTLLWIAGLAGLLGTALIVVGLLRPKQTANSSDASVGIPPNPDSNVAPAPMYCSTCKIEVVPDADSRCPTCGWSN